MNEDSVYKIDEVVRFVLKRRNEQRYEDPDNRPRFDSRAVIDLESPISDSLYREKNGKSTPLCMLNL